MYGKVINKGGTPPHKERRPYFTFTKKYEKTNAVHRNILSVMSLRVVVYCLFIEKGKYEYKQIVCG